MTWKGAFDPQNRFWSFMEKLTDLFVLSLFWLLCSLPLFTIGASTVSLYTFTLKQADDRESYAVRSFFRQFAGSFLPATGLWLLTVLGFGLLYGNLYALGVIRLPQTLRVFFYGCTLGLGLLFVLDLLWAYPLLAFYKVRMGKCLKDGLIMALRHPLATLALLGIWLVVFLLIWWVAFFLWLWIPLGLFCSSLVLSPILEALPSSL